MTRDDTQKTDRRTRIGREDLEGRSLQSALVQPPASATAAYHTTVWGPSHGEHSTIKGEFVSIKGETGDIKTKTS